MILDISTGSLEISDFSEDSPAKVAGMKEKDKILALNGHFVSKMSDVQKIMWDKKPGDQVLVKASRKADQDKDKTLEFEVKLR